VKTKRQETGRLGEKLARDFLKKRCFRIVDTNYRCPQGEIDIICRDGEYLVFAEVRTKTSREFGSPEESITQSKKKRMLAAAYHYWQAYGNSLEPWRIDLVAIELDKEGKLTRIELIENALSES
jgi:putative endonuclease